MTNALANVSAEQTVLGSILLSPDTSAFLVEMLEPEDFANEHHRAIFGAISAAISDGKPPHPVMLAPALRDIAIPELNVNCAAYCGRLMASGITVRDAVHYVTHLRGFSARRQMADIAEQMAAVARNQAANAGDFALEAITGLDAISTRMRRRRQSSFDMGAIARDAVEQLQIGKKPDMITTGLRDLDKVLGGLHRGELMIVAGRPSMGKSALLFSMARQGARQGTRTLLFSLEMGHKAVGARMLSDAVWNRETPIPYDRILKGEVTPYEIERLGCTADGMAALPIEIDDQPGLTVADIAIRARRYAERMAKAGERLDAIAIDHLGKVAASSRYAGNKVHETGEKTNALAVLGRELDVAMVVAHQLNRGNEKRDNKRPEMADLRDSGDVEQDADAIIFPFRLSYYLERMKEDDHDKERDRRASLDECRNLMEVNVAKNRNGACRNLEFYCDMASNVVRDRA